MIAWKKGRIEVVLQLLDCGAKVRYPLSVLN